MIVIGLHKTIDKKSFISMVSKYYNAPYPFSKWEKLSVVLIKDSKVFVFISMMSKNKKRRFGRKYCIEIPSDDYKILLRDGKIRSIW